tara:strand:- start:341 stop:985 length:645 start_codon:yes stop_codon:yes gene_type:complete
MFKKLILIRHGESIWNRQNRFTGWANVELTKIGKIQAKKTGELLLKHNILPEICFTSNLNRSIDTNKIILNSMGINDIPIIKSWRLNEKHYGKLTGYHKEYDIKWKGEYFDIPPVINSFNGLDINGNKLYNPKFGESYYMTFLRVYPLWKMIIPKILNGKNPIICSHKNSIKVLIQHLENLNIKNINNIEVPNAEPIIYYFDDNMKLISKKNLK